ncbi:MAG: hypothetical protein RLY43_1325 [Bacteroidota bacterium]|jgi:hypothetical protein
MPIPKLLPREQAGEFVQRCIMDPVMVKEFPDINQRIAVCRNQLTENASQQSKNKRGKK